MYNSDYNPQDAGDTKNKLLVDRCWGSATVETVGYAPLKSPERTPFLAQEDLQATRETQPHPPPSFHCRSPGDPSNQDRVTDLYHNCPQNAWSHNTSSPFFMIIPKKDQQCIHCS